MILDGSVEVGGDLVVEVDVGALVGDTDLFGEGFGILHEFGDVLFVDLDRF